MLTCEVANGIVICDILSWLSPGLLQLVLCSPFVTIWIWSGGSSRWNWNDICTNTVRTEFHSAFHLECDCLIMYFGLPPKLMVVLKLWLLHCKFYKGFCAFYSIGHYRELYREFCRAWAGYRLSGVSTQSNGVFYLSIGILSPLYLEGVNPPTTSK